MALLIAARAESQDSVSAFPDHVDLRKSVPIEVDGRKAKGVQIAKMGRDAFKRLDMELNTDFVSIDDLYTFGIVKSADGDHPKFSVMVEHLPRPSDSPPLPPAPGILMEEPIATFEIVDEHLCLVWNPRHATSHVGQLANASLQVSLQGRQKRIGLRKPLVATPIALDLSKSTQRIPLRVDFLPGVGEACVVLLDIDEVSQEFEIPEGGVRITAGHPKTLTREMSVRNEFAFSLENTKKGLELHVNVHYYDAHGRRRELSVDQVKAAALGLSRSHASATQKLSSAKSGLPGIEAEIQRLSNYRPSQQEAAAVAGRLQELQRQRSRALSTIRRFERSIPKIEDSMADMKPVIELGESLHNSARLHIAFEFVQKGKILRLAETQ